MPAAWRRSPSRQDGELDDDEVRSGGKDDEAVEHLVIPEDSRRRVGSPSGEVDRAQRVQDASCEKEDEPAWSDRPGELRDAKDDEPPVDQVQHLRQPSGGRWPEQLQRYAGERTAPRNGQRRNRPRAAEGEERDGGVRACDENVGPPGTGKTHLAIGLSIRACQAGHRVAFATAAEWVARLGDAHSQGRLHDELRRLGRTPLLVIDEVGYVPFEAEAANLFFQLISSRYERASVIVTSNKPFGRWGEVFGDATVAAAMIDRLVHHAEVISLKGDSYRLKDRDLGRVPTDDAA